jgi:hypothetical protein
MGFSLKKYSEGKWLKGSDFGEDERKVLTITECFRHTFESGDVRPALKFQEIDQWLSVNKTRNTKLRQLFGDESDALVGKRIVTYAGDASFGGKPEKTVVIAAYKEQQPVLNPDEEFMRDVDSKSRP